MKFLLLAAGMLTTGFTNAQIVKQPLSVNYQNPGAYSLHFSDIFSATSNQASLARLKTGGFGAFGERRFLLSELNSYRFIAAIPSSSGTFGLQGTYLGSQAFNENELGLIYARKISSSADIGVKFNYFTIHIPGYGNASSLNFDAGAIFHLSDKFHAGIHVYNPTKSRIGKTGNERLASAYKAGAGYEVSENVFISAELVKQEALPMHVNAGLQYNISKKISLRTGISTNTDNSYAGVEIQLSFAKIGLNTSYHPQLGFTPGLLILLNFKKPAED